MVVFDASHPREKPCGGGLTGRAVGLVSDELRESQVRAVAVQGAVFEAARVDGHATAPLHARVPLTPAGLTAASSLVIVSRRSFDGALLEAAVRSGACHVEERVRDVVAGGDSVKVSTIRQTITCDAVIGADGANSMVRRRVRAPFQRSQLSIAAGAFVHGRTEADVRLCMLANPGGYLWSFPRPDHLAIGGCAQADAADIRQLRATVSEWMTGRKLHGNGPVEEYTWPIPSLTFTDFEREAPAGPRWMLVGDAAGVVDPLTREGIFYALRSAELAAAALAGPSPRETYTSMLRDEIYPELRRAAALKAGFFSSGFSSLMVEALGRSGRIRAVMADLVAGRQSYKALVPRLLATREFGLAFRLASLLIGGRLRR